LDIDALIVIDYPEQNHPPRHKVVPTSSHVEIVEYEESYHRLKSLRKEMYGGSFIVTLILYRKE